MAMAAKKGKYRRPSTGSYSRNRKSLTADRYGEFRNGIRITADVIAGVRVGRDAQ